MTSANAIGLSGGIRACRRARGITQQRLAELAKCSVAMVRLLESGYVPESSAVLDRVEGALAKFDGDDGLA